MASLRANLFRIGFGAYNIVGSKSKKSFTERVRKLSAPAINDLCPEGFTYTKETTSSGTVYERITKNGEKKNGRVLYFLHGGGYIVGLLFFYRNFATSLYDSLGRAEMILLDYKCSPEYKYPTQHDEAMDLWEELVERQGYLPENIIAGGDSAGANLLLSVMLKLRDNGKALPKAAFCLSPWTDTTGSGKSFERNFSKDVMLGSIGKKYSEEAKQKSLESDLYDFVGDADRHSPYISPVYGSYEGFPPMFFTVGGDEMLLDDTLRVVEKLKACNVRVEYDVQPKMFHVYPLFGNMIPESKASCHKLADFISRQYD